MKLSITAMLLLCLSAVAISYGCQVAPEAVKTPIFPPSSSILTSKEGWSSYDNSSFGLTFQYPPSLTILLDEPDTSGIQLVSENLRLAIILNPRTDQSVDEYAAQLRQFGFQEKRRSPLEKGSWKGLRLEGDARDGVLQIDFPEVVYLAKSRDSLISMIGIWDGTQPDYSQVETIWESVELQASTFAVSPAVLRSDSTTTLNSPDGSYSLRYPTHWQAGFLDESLLVVSDLDDPESFILTVKRKDKGDRNMDDSIELALLELRIGFEDVSVNNREKTLVQGATEAVKLTGTLNFRDGAKGMFQAIVAIEADDIFILSAAIDLTRADSVLPDILQVFYSFRID